MLREMTHVQLQEWMVFAELEPFSEERMDYRFGSLALILSNAHRNSKTHPSPYSLEDTTLMFGDSPRPQKKQMDWQAMKALGQAMTEKSKEKKPKQERISGRKLERHLPKP